MNKAKVQEMLNHLTELYPDADCELHYQNPFQLLIAVILSAQCTDKLVNQVTPGLFEKFPDAVAFSEATVSEIEEAIRKIGLFRSKAKHIKEACRILVEKYEGEVPSDHKLLTDLPGVGRKTANVVQSVAFGVPAIAVDTHVDRLAHRIGLTKATTVLKTEEDLMKKIPKSNWVFTHHALILHGRRVCVARSPKCDICPLTDLCTHYRLQLKKTTRNLQKPRKSRESS